MPARRLPVLLALAGALAAAAPAGAATKPPAAPTPTAAAKPPANVPQAGATYRFVSRPDLRPPAVNVATSLPGQAPGSVFLAPKLGQGQAGPMIVRPDGQLVWFNPSLGEVRANDFRTAIYDGKEVLTYWEGIGAGGYGQGEGVILDQGYHVIKRVKPGGLQGDLHEFLLTPRGTAYMTVYLPTTRDLRPWGGAKDGVVLDGIVREVDVKTGKVLFTWHSLGNVGLSESVAQAPAPGSFDYWDYFHVNSIDEDTDGNLIVSARLTDTIYKINKKTGAIMWRLGGTRSDYKLGPGAAFARQHDARREADGTISLFDNSAIDGRERSRGIRLRLNDKTKKATLASPVFEDGQFFAPTQGNVQLLDGGNAFVGWGNRGRASEYGPTGNLLLDLRLARGYDSYRAFKGAWVGTPDSRPRAVIAPQGKGRTAFVSWNGATQVAGWQLLAGGQAGLGATGVVVPATGFETRVDVTGRQFVALQALDANGAPLGKTVPLRVVPKS